jgi:hypothetical protein
VHAAFSTFPRQFIADGNQPLSHDLLLVPLQQLDKPPLELQDHGPGLASTMPRPADLATSSALTRLFTITLIVCGVRNVSLASSAPEIPG